MKQVGKPVTLSLDGLIFVTSLLRLYTIYPRCLLTHYADDYSPESERVVRVCRMNGSNGGVLFTLKAYMTLQPYWVFAALLSASLFVFAFSIRTFEMGIEDEFDNSNVSISLWLVIQTLTLTGYGDITPATHLGRLLSAVECISGVMCMALLVAALSNSTDFTPTEDKVFNAIVADQAVRSQLREDAGVIVKDFLVLMRLKKK